VKSEDSSGTHRIADVEPIPETLSEAQRVALLSAVAPLSVLIGAVCSEIWIDDRP
jgi:hypothetical protein